MRRLMLLITLGLGPCGANAETVVALRTLRTGSMIMPGDLTTVAGQTEGAARTIEEVIGLELRETVYQGRPVMQALLGPPALFERNAIVALEYRRDLLTIRAEGRALDRGGVGDRVRVMNLASRRIVEGIVAGNGSVQLAEMP